MSRKEEDLRPKSILLFTWLTDMHASIPGTGVHRTPTLGTQASAQRRTSSRSATEREEEIRAKYYLCRRVEGPVRVGRSKIDTRVVAHGETEPGLQHAGDGLSIVEPRNARCHNGLGTECLVSGQLCGSHVEQGRGGEVLVALELVVDQVLWGNAVRQGRSSE